MYKNLYTSFDPHDRLPVPGRPDDIGLGPRQRLGERERSTPIAARPTHAAVHRYPFTPLGWSVSCWEMCRLLLSEWGMVSPHACGDTRVPVCQRRRPPVSSPASGRQEPGHTGPEALVQVVGRDGGANLPAQPRSPQALSAHEDRKSVV